MAILNDLLNTQNTNPAMLIAELLRRGTAKTIYGQNDPSMADVQSQASQSGMQAGQQVGNMVLNSGREGILKEMQVKAAKKVTEKQVLSQAEEAAKQPNGQQILADFIAKAQTNQDNLASTYSQPSDILTPPAQPTQNTAVVTPADKNVTGERGTWAMPVDERGIPQPGGLLGRLLGYNDPEVMARKLTNAGLTQELLGKKPMQEGKREELNIINVNEMMKERVKGLVELNKEGMLKPKDLYEGFRNDSREFLKVRDAQGRIESSAKDPSAAGDLALIFNYMKVLDPGSTVREGEFANAESSGAAWEGAGKLYNKILSGKRLSSNQRADFVARSRKLFKGMESQQSKNVSEYQRLAKANNIDFNRIMADTGLILNQESQGTTQNQTQPGTVSVTKGGNSFRRVQ